MFILDVNVWLPLAFQRHLHHKPATDWFMAAPENSCCFCRSTQISFLRLATTPQVMTTDVLTLTASWQAFDKLYNDPRVVFAEEPQGMEPLWRGYTQHQSFSPKVWNFANLAALASAADFELVTFDKGFAQYQGLAHTIQS
jgi:toxin-antitoxin system PIN domain toxin